MGIIYLVPFIFFVEIGLTVSSTYSCCDH